MEITPVKIEPRPPVIIEVDDPEIKLRPGTFRITPAQLKLYYDARKLNTGFSMFNKIMGFLKGRATELSTYLGVGLVSLIGVAPELSQEIVNVVVAIVGLLFVIKPDKGVPAITPPAG